MTTPAMTTLRIEHEISDLAVWREAFDRFADARAQAGVRRHRIHQPVDDSAYVLVDLDFDDTAAAERFLGFLRTNVWAVPDNAPALVGALTTSLIHMIDAS